MDKEDVAHIYNVILAIKRNEIELFVVRWTDLESVIQSEISQKEKNKYCMLTRMYAGSSKKLKIELPYDAVTPLLSIYIKEMKTGF